jgi:uncharacterized circularly permuted ATP-grasp superfamily protein
MVGPDGSIRAPYTEVAKWLEAAPPDQLERLRIESELLYRRGGITFAVYADAAGEERIIPFDIVPRMISTASGRGWSVARRSACAR